MHTCFFVCYMGVSRHSLQSYYMAIVNALGMMPPRGCAPSWAFPRCICVPAQAATLPADPVVSIESVNELAGSVSITSIVQPGDRRLVTVGFCWTTDPSSPPTTANESLSRRYTHKRFVFAVYGDEVTTYGRSYVIDSDETVWYSATVSFTNRICFAEGTLIATWQAQSKEGSDAAYDPASNEDDRVRCVPLRRIVHRPIETIWYTDELVVWDFDEGCLASAYPTWIKCAEQERAVVVTTLSTGTQLRTVGKHRALRQGDSCFEPLVEMTAGSRVCVLPDGAVTDADVVRLAWATIHDHAHVPCSTAESGTPAASTRSFNIVTAGHMNVFANGVLTSCRFNNYGVIDTSTMKIHAPVRTTLTHTQASSHISLADTAFALYAQSMRLQSQAPSVSATANAYFSRMHASRARAVIFLDHQGVMRTIPNPTPGSLVDFDVAAITALNTLLVEDPSLDIVVLSDWKRWVSLETMQAFYKAQGILRVPIAFTPEVLMSGEETEHVPCIMSLRRVKEIAAWLAQHASAVKQTCFGGRWVAIDDLPLASASRTSDRHHYIQTNASTGLPAVLQAVRQYRTMVS